MQRDTPWAIDLAGLRFAYPGERDEVLAIDALQVGWEERVLVRGPSGCGKSTLLSLLGGVFAPGAGSLRIAGIALERLSARARDRFRADHVGFVFQMFNLVPYLSILDNVMLPCTFSVRRREKVLARGASPAAEARRLLARLELDDPALLRRPVTRLSIGQQQRVAAARALMGAPELVIADEPTSALDEDARERFLDLLFAECREAGATAVVVSHDARLARCFDRRLELPQLNRASHGAPGGAGQAA